MSRNWSWHCLPPDALWRTKWRALTEKVCSALPLPTILSLEEVELSDALGCPETTSISPTRKTMIRPGAKPTT
jgi:hypothetical protein